MSFNTNIDDTNYGATEITVACPPKVFENTDGSATLKLSGYHHNRDRQGKNHSDLLQFERFVPAAQKEKVLGSWPWGELDAGDRVRVYFSLTGRLYTDKSGEQRYYATNRVTAIKPLETKAERMERKARKAEAKAKAEVPVQLVMEI